MLSSPEETTRELEALNRLLSERFGDSTVDIARTTSQSVPLDDATIQTTEEHEATAFPLFAPCQPSKIGEENQDVALSSTSATRKRKRGASRANMPLVRLMSPVPVYTGPGKGRILAVEDEDPDVTELRRSRIAETAMTSAYIQRTSSARHWSPHHTDALKITSRKLLASQYGKKDPFPPLGRLSSSLYPTAPAAPSTRELPKLRVIAYPRQDIIRLEKRISKVAQKQGTEVQALITTIEPVNVLASESKESEVVAEGTASSEVAVVQKKKKAGKKERMRLKAAKEKEEQEVEAQKQAIRASRLVLNDGRNGKTKKKRKSKWRRMYERAGRDKIGEIRKEISLVKRKNGNRKK